MKLDRSKPFGKISPAYQESDMDRPAYFEQDGKFFDAHDRLIEPGKPLPAPKPAAAPVVAIETGTPTADETLPATRLLAEADSMPWPKFRAAAKKVLGETCPGDKEGIKAALAAGIAAVQEREAKRAPSSASSNGLTWDSVSGGKEAAAASGGVDLKSWATGQREYLFAEVQKTIRKTYNKQVSERVDAVNFLVDQGLLTADQARRDV